MFGSPYWTSEIYGFGKYIRKYGYYPSWLPLYIYTDHGVGRIDPAIHELESSAPALLYVLDPRCNDWGRVSQGEFQALDYFVSCLPTLVLPTDTLIRLSPHPLRPSRKI